MVSFKRPESAEEKVNNPAYCGPKKCGNYCQLSKSVKKTTDYEVQCIAEPSRNLGAKK
tara:strand:- start:1021 stop:1194 length:174 start_codon:yes stop_codon:yes gene_type:complete